MKSKINCITCNNQDFKNLRILNLNFEDFVLNHKKTIQKISEFISEDLSIHLEDFNLERSKNNLFKFKNLLEDSEILIIEETLKKYLYNK